MSTRFSNHISIETFNATSFRLLLKREICCYFRFRNSLKPVWVLWANNALPAVEVYVFVYFILRTALK